MKTKRKTQRKTQRPSSNSAAELSKVLGKSNQVLPPDGITLETDQQVVIWGQFSQLRNREDWRDFDLVLLYKLVKLEELIRKAQKSVGEKGMVITNARGTPIPNPVFSLMDTLQRQQLAIIRSMSLNQTASDPRTLNKAGSKNEASQKKLAELDGLIARPH